MVKIDLSIVIVSWNTKKITEDCIESINRSLTNTKINYEIIVVDNDSRDGSAQTLQKIVLNKESHLVYFQSGSNLGFGRGNNFGVKKANGKYILLLNTDMIVLNRAIEKLYNFYIQNEKQVHFLGAKLLNHDLTPQPSACRFFTLPVVFATLLLKGDYWGLTRYSPNKFCRIDWISGACILTTKKLYQRLGGLNPEQIVEIIDHHKPQLNLGQPIFLNFKVWGSTSTIIYYFMKQQGIMPEAKLAGLMLAAILSDTVGYKSPTTTDKDRKFGAELANLAGIKDVEAFTLEIFKAKSDISSLTDEQIVRNDFKIFEFNKKTFIDQLETVEQDSILNNKKDSLLKAMQKTKEAEGVELLFVAITDILKVNTILLILGEEEARVAEKAFGGQVKDHTLDIGSKLSRKKEIAPAIEKALA